MPSRLVPKDWIWSATAFWAPVPSATMVITAATPITMPSIVRAERSLLARMAPSATPRISPKSMSARDDDWSAATLLGAAGLGLGGGLGVVLAHARNRAELLHPLPELVLRGDQ